LKPEFDFSEQSWGHWKRGNTTAAAATPTTTKPGGGEKWPSIWKLLFQQQQQRNHRCTVGLKFFRGGYLGLWENLFLFRMLLWTLKFCNIIHLQIIVVSMTLSSIFSAKYWRYNHLLLSIIQFRNKFYGLLILTSLKETYSDHCIFWKWFSIHQLKVQTFFQMVFISIILNDQKFISHCCDNDLVFYDTIL